MDNIQKAAVNQTPIEIALGIDENGMTTARKLFDFLGMSTNNYSRWFKSNITDNDFAEENVDFFLFLTNEEHKGHASQDARLTASFAKKLSMQQKNERGEQARNYFVGIEDKAKDLVLILKQASGDPMKMLKLHYEALEQVDKKVADVGNKVETLEDRFNKFEEELPMLPDDADEVHDALNKRVVFLLGGGQSNAYKDKSLTKKVFIDAYRVLKYNFGVTRYKAIRRNQKAKALQVIEEYKPPVFLAEQIETTNAQQRLDV